VGAPVMTDPVVGDYHRMLLPGTYQLRFASLGYQTLEQNVTVSTGRATRLDVRLDR
jgi:carboxypeptidase T